MRTRGILVFAVAGLSLFFIGCQGSGGGKGVLVQKDLYTNDKAGVTGMKSVGASSVDSYNNQAFTKVFGGTNGANVLSYIDTRVKYVWNSQEVKNIRVEPGNISGADFFGGDEPTPSKDAPVVAAENIGSAFWLESRIAETPFGIRKDGVLINVESSRVGIISLGDSYLPSIVVEGKSYNIPPEYRVSTVVHEARHSDCTGGFPDAYVAKAKVAKTIDDFLKAIGQKQLVCTHGHVNCPSNHEFAGFPACDYEVWGAYGVGTVYSMAMQKNYEYGTIEYAIMEVSAQDNLSRLLGAGSSPFSKSSPDMSSQNE